MTIYWLTCTDGGEKIAIQVGNICTIKERKGGAIITCNDGEAHLVEETFDAVVATIESLR